MVGRKQLPASPVKSPSTVFVGAPPAAAVTAAPITAPEGEDAPEGGPINRRRVRETKVRLFFGCPRRHDPFVLSPVTPAPKPLVRQSVATAVIYAPSLQSAAAQVFEKASAPQGVHRMLLIPVRSVPAPCLWASGGKWTVCGVGFVIIAVQDDASRDRIVGKVPRPAGGEVIRSVKQIRRRSQAWNQLIP